MLIKNEEISCDLNLTTGCKFVFIIINGSIKIFSSGISFTLFIQLHRFRIFNKIGHTCLILSEGLCISQDCCNSIIS